jgi:hypothetical protein
MKICDYKLGMFPCEIKDLMGSPTIHWHHDSLTHDSLTHDSLTPRFTDTRFTDNTKSVVIHILGPAPNTKSVGIPILGPVPIQKV